MKNGFNSYSYGNIGNTINFEDDVKTKDPKD